MKSYTLCQHLKSLSGNRVYLFFAVFYVLFGQDGRQAFAHSAPSAKASQDVAEAPQHHGHTLSPQKQEHEGHEPDVEKGSLRAGATIYKHMCVFCHGEDGNGGGKAIAYLYPWPRDFRKGVFKYHTTPGGSLPLDTDLFKTISRGIPGTSMPSWRTALSDEEISALIKYIKKFSRRFDEEKPRPAIKVGPAPATTPDNVARGEKLFYEMRCDRCHGADLKGDSPIADQLFDIWDHLIFIYDLTNPNAFKWGYEKEDIFRTLTVGVDGTPMRAYEHLPDEDRWDLAAFVQSKITLGQLQKAEYEVDLYAKKTDQPIGLDPDAPIWSDVPAKAVHLMPLSARANPINRIKVQSLINDQDIAIRLEWEDVTQNQSSSRNQDFKDAVATEFALGEVLLHEHGHNEPFYGMGNRGKVVNVWQWRADWQQEIAIKKKLDQVASDPQMDVPIFGGEVYPVDSQTPFRESPVEELNAEGFGTLTPQPLTKQNVKGNGVWKDGKWAVVLQRTIKSLNKWDADFSSGKGPILTAFAIWDGAHADRNGRKTISMWQRLNLP